MRASFLPGIFKYIEKRFVPGRITACWEAINATVLGIRELRERAFTVTICPGKTLRDFIFKHGVRSG